MTLEIPDEEALILFDLLADYGEPGDERLPQLAPVLKSAAADGETELGCLMPFKSQAQRRKFAELLVQGKISNQTFEEWNRETGGRKLPERVKRKTKTSRKRK